MLIKKNSIYLAKLNSIKSVIEKTTDERKQNLIGASLANEFNKLLDEVSQEYADIKSSLPAKITSQGPYSDMQMADINYTDLEIFTEIVISLLNLINE